MTTENFSVKERELAVNTLRMLSVDMVERANSGHPGMPMGCADVAFVLWMNFLRFNPRDPKWINRDRFILSAGHGSALLYSLLHLSGFDLPMEELKAFRQLGSRTPGHPEYGLTEGVETTTGPLGQGFANGVGMALAQQLWNARLEPKEPLLNHYIYAIVGDGDLMEGVSAEAASLAGHLGLGHLVYIYDDNHITIDGDTSLSFSEDVGKRFGAYGWHVQRIDGHDHGAIQKAIESARHELGKPSLIIARTQIGKGAPTKQNTSGVHGAPLGREEREQTRKNLAWDLGDFSVPTEIYSLFKKRAESLMADYENWNKRWERFQTEHPNSHQLWQDGHAGSVPEALKQELNELIYKKDIATRAVSGQIMQQIAKHMPTFVGGSADLAESVKTLIKESSPVAKDDFTGSNLYFGVREHAMGSILNGLALYGGLTAYGSTFLVFSDYMRPAIRLSALMKLPVIYVFSHDSFYLGEDGPTHQPIEQLSTLRMIPNMRVLRPADAEETVACWQYALENRKGPTAIILTRQNLPILSRDRKIGSDDMHRGAYVIREGGKTPSIILLASGSELSLAMEVAERLAEKSHAVRVVSVPSLEGFLAQALDYQQEILPESCQRRVAIEAGVSNLWYQLLGHEGFAIGMTSFGESAPAEALAPHFGFTAESILKKILEKWEL